MTIEELIEKTGDELPDELQTRDVMNLLSFISYVYSTNSTDATLLLLGAVQIVQEQDFPQTQVH